MIVVQSEDLTVIKEQEISRGQKVIGRINRQHKEKVFMQQAATIQ